MNTKFANQIQLGAGFALTTDAIAAIGDSVETAVGKLQAQNFAAGVGTYISGWAADTNTPTLLNSTIEAAGNWYNCTAAGTVDFGAGGIAFALNDRCYSNGTTYQKGDAITSDVLLATNNILVGQSNGIGSGVAMSGDASIVAAGTVTLAFGASLTAGTFDGTVRGGGIQYFNTNINVAITDMVLGRPYKLRNSDAASKTITVTGTSAAVIGGDALTNALVQTVNPGCCYTYTIQNATTVLIS